MAMRNPDPPRRIDKLTDVIRWPGAAWREIERLRDELRRLTNPTGDTLPVSEAVKGLLVDDELSEP
jgi:uncharacterized protein YjiS (DUF1127 family)